MTMAYTVRLYVVFRNTCVDIISDKVSLGEENMKELAKQWVENYQKEPAGPLRDLVNFFIRVR